MKFLDGAILAFVVLLLFFAFNGSELFASKQVTDVTRLVNTYYDENEVTNDTLQNSEELVSFLKKANVTSKIISRDDHSWVLVETTEGNFLPVETLQKSFVYGSDMQTYLE